MLFKDSSYHAAAPGQLFVYFVSCYSDFHMTKLQFQAAVLMVLFIYKAVSSSGLFVSVVPIKPSVQVIMVMVLIFKAVGSGGLFVAVLI